MANDKSAEERIGILEKSEEGCQKNYDGSCGQYTGLKREGDAP